MRLKTNKYIKRNKQENILIKIITINNNQADKNIKQKKINKHIYFYLFGPDKA